jgi:hypothetical protein
VSEVAYTDKQLYKLPQVFADRITRVGGLNLYGQPNFKMIWGMGGEKACLFRAGGEWAGGGQVTYKGYRDLLLSGDPCWVLLHWQAPEKYGAPNSYYVANYDVDTSLQTLGEYPYRGRYEIVLPLIWKGIVNGRLKIESMPLSSLLIDLIIPVIKETAGLSNARKRQLMLDHKEREDRAQTSQIEASLASAYPAFGSAPRSAARLSCTSVIQKRAEAIERHWKTALKTLSKRGKGLSSGVLK